MSASALARKPGTGKEEALNLTIAGGARENPWIKGRVKRVMTEVINQCLTEAQITGTVSITFLCIRDCLKKKDRPPHSITLQRTFRQEGPNALPVLVVGKDCKKDICYVTLVMPTDAKVLLMSFFEKQREKDTFRYVMEPKVVTQEMLQEIHEEDEDDDDVSEGLCELTPIDDTVAILYLTEVRSMGGEITRGTAEALVRTHFPEKDWSLDGNLVEVMLNDGYLKRNPEGSIVKLTQKANDLLAEEEVRTKASLLSMSETLPQPEAKRIVSAEEMEIQQLLILRNRIKETRARLAEAEEQNAKVEQTLIPLRARNQAVQTEMNELEKQAVSCDAQVEKHKKKAAEFRNSYAEKRNTLLEIQAQIRENSDQANTMTAAIKADLEELLREQQKLLVEV